MNRSTFVKSIFALTGTAFVYGCKEAEQMMVEPNDISLPPDLAYSKKWFYDKYLPQFASASGRLAGNPLHRQVDWSSSEEVKNGKEHFIWAPVKYASEDMIPQLVTWEEGQEYIPKLAKYLSWRIAEGFITYRNESGEYNGFLAQITYDPFKHKPGLPIDSKRFTGMIVHAAWDESPLRIWRFQEGTLHSSHDINKKKRAKLQQCQTIYYNYNTATGTSCGPNCTEVTITVHTGSYTYCNDSGGSGGGTGGSGSQGYPYYDGGGSGGQTTPPSSSGPVPFQGYNFAKVGARDGSQDYQVFMQRLSNFLDVFNIPAATFGASFTYADTMLKALGIEGAVLMSLETRTITVAGLTRTIGIVGAATSAASIYISYSDKGYMSYEDWLNSGAVVLGVVSAFTPVGWVALSTGVASAAISFYTAATPGN